jgi:hypothetical protein
VGVGFVLNHLTHSNAKAKNEWSYTCTAPYAFMAFTGTIFYIVLLIYLWFFKDTVTISNCIMSASRIIVKCLWLYLMYHSSVCLGQQRGHAVPR